MTVELTHMDTVGIQLPKKLLFPLHPHLIQLQLQVNNLTQTLAGLLAHLRAQPASAPPSAPLPL